MLWYIFTQVSTQILACRGPCMHILGQTGSVQARKGIQRRQVEGNIMWMYVQPYTEISL